MTVYELTNEQRKYFGLDQIENHWEKFILKGDSYRPESILYFDGNIIKRNIISTENRYLELHYNELTKDRKILLPKTERGKEKKLTASVLDQRQPTGVYVSVNSGVLKIGNYNTQTTFYSSHWGKSKTNEAKRIQDLINEFIEQSPENHLKDIYIFKSAKRKNVKYKSGDYFCFKLNRTEFGFGRILLDINKIRKKKLLPSEHGLNLLMGPPLLVQLFAYKADTKFFDISMLDKQPKLPSDVMMDNLLLYGEYEIIGHRELNEEDFEFPISYGKSIDQRKIFFQWGLIHKELPKEKFNKYLTGEKTFDQNPFGYYSIGFEPAYKTLDIIKTIENEGVYDYSQCEHYRSERDLRNPQNESIKNEIFAVFGLNPNKTYIENCLLSETQKTTELLKKL